MTSPLPARPTHIRYFVLAAICVVTVINYVQRNSIGGLVTPIVSALQTDDTHVGLSGTCFFVAYALMQIPSGALAQRWGPRAALTIYTVGWSLATAGMALSINIWFLVGSRTLMGALQAGIFPCATLIMAAWLPPERRAFASGLLNSFMLIGGALVSNLTGFLLVPKGPLGWRELLLCYSVPGLLWAGWFYFWFRNRPSEHPAVNAAEMALIVPVAPAQKTEYRIPWTMVMFSLALWLICVQQFCRAGANRFTDQWLSRYLQQGGPLGHITDEGLRNSVANQLASFPQYAGVIGGLIGGALSDLILTRTGSRRAGRNGVAIISLLVTILAYSPIFLTSDATMQVVFFSMGSFISAFAAPCAYALTMDVGGRNLPVVFGAMNMLGNFGAAAMTGVVPLINKATGGWTGSLILFVGVHLVALLCWLFLNPDRTIGETTE